jgi:hypothetical protein
MTVTVTDQRGCRIFKNVTKITECGSLFYLNYESFKNDALIKENVQLAITA